MTCSWVGGRAQLPPEPRASLGEFAGRAQWVQGQGPCTPSPHLPIPQLYGGPCWVVLWSLPGLLVLAGEHKTLAWGSACPTPGPSLKGLLLPRGLWGPKAFLTDPSPHLPHSTLGSGTGGGIPRVGGWLSLLSAHSRWFLANDSADRR